MYGSDIDGTSRIAIPHGNFYGIVDTLPDERDSVLVTRSIDNAFLFKLNAYNGRITRVASSPLDAGSFLVDHQGNVRYSFRSAERRVGKEGVHTCRSRWSPYH